MVVQRIFPLDCCPITAVNNGDAQLLATAVCCSCWENISTEALAPEEPVVLVCGALTDYDLSLSVGVSDVRVLPSCWEVRCTYIRRFSKFDAHAHLHT